jgi:hypothetical protein
MSFPAKGQSRDIRPRTFLGVSGEDRSQEILELGESREVVLVNV